MYNISFVGICLIVRVAPSGRSFAHMRKIPFIPNISLENRLININTLLIYLGLIISFGVSKVQYYGIPFIPTIGIKDKLKTIRFPLKVQTTFKKLIFKKS